MKQNFFTELSRVLAKHDIETAPPERNALPILLNGFPACRALDSGVMRIFPGDLRSPEANELYHKAAPFSSEVHEYLTAIERAPVLKATSLDEVFRLLAEFNGVVLAGRETEYGYMFVTWEQDYEGAGAGRLIFFGWLSGGKTGLRHLRGGWWKSSVFFQTPSFLIFTRASTMHGTEFWDSLCSRLS